jgi:hypothetical protein
MSEEDKKESALPEKKEAEEKKEDQPESAIEPEVLEKLPPELRKAVEFSMVSGSVPVFNPIYKKINEKHIDKILDQTESDSQREHQDKQSTKRYTLLYVLIVAALFVFTTIYLVGQDKDLYRDILIKLVIYLGGVGSGIGIKAFRDRDRD